MTNFTRGQKGKLAEMGCIGIFPVALHLSVQGMDIDTSCFGLDVNGQLSDDRYMVFFNQKSCPGGYIRLEIDNNNNNINNNIINKSTFHIDVENLPNSIEKLVFTAAINGEGTMHQLGASSLSLGSTTFTFSGVDFQAEKAVIIGEIYKRDGQWRFGAVGQGFNGGLSALLKNFGGTEEASPSAPATTPLPESKKVSLSKVTLEKRGDKISLQKVSGVGGGGFGRTRINLNWNQKPASTPTATPTSATKEVEKTSFLSRVMNHLPKNLPKIRSQSGIDLDLGCFFEMADGYTGGIQALGDSWGDFNNEPYIQLDNDDRSGTNTAGENLFINGDQFQHIKRVLIYTFIYEGAPNWAATDGIVTIEIPGRAPVEVKLDNGTNASMCAIAMIENIGGNLQITKLVEYFQGNFTKLAHQLMNDRFKFGLHFEAGRKN